MLYIHKYVYITFIFILLCMNNPYIRTTNLLPNGLFWTLMLSKSLLICSMSYYHTSMSGEEKLVLRIEITSKKFM
jgi:hypothetical protein